MKNILRIHRQPEGHWVGDGFPVHTVLDYQRHPELSPFLLLDGEVDHEDTAGNGGRIGQGEVQWMTAGSGLLHKEMHSPEFTRRGGRFQALQLWVNLPAKSKMAPPRYQTLTAASIPVVDGVRVIAGEYRGAKGPAQTFTTVNLFDVRLRAGQTLSLDLRDGFSAGLYVVQGEILVNGQKANATELVVLDRAGNDAELTATTDAVVFVMNGAPIDEPVVGYGPFVMNTTAEIQQAYADFHAGRLGTIPAKEKVS